MRKLPSKKQALKRDAMRRMEVLRLAESGLFSQGEISSLTGKHPGRPIERARKASQRFDQRMSGLEQRNIRPGQPPSAQNREERLEKFYLDRFSSPKLGREWLQKMLMNLRKEKETLLALSRAVGERQSLEVKEKVLEQLTETRARTKKRGSPMPFRKILEKTGDQLALPRQKKEERLSLPPPRKEMPGVLQPRQQAAQEALPRERSRARQPTPREKLETRIRNLKREMNALEPGSPGYHIRQKKVIQLQEQLQRLKEGQAF